MTVLHTPPVAETGVDLSAALAHLAAAGVTAEVLAADGVDPTIPAQLRDLVHDLLASALAEDAIADERQVCDLQAALDALTPAEEHAALDAMAYDMLAFLTEGRRRPPDLAPVPVYGGACLDAE